MPTALRIRSLSSHKRHTQALPQGWVSLRHRKRSKFLLCLISLQAPPCQSCRWRKTRSKILSTPRDLSSAMLKLLVNLFRKSTSQRSGPSRPSFPQKGKFESGFPRCLLTRLICAPIEHHFDSFCLHRILLDIRFARRCPSLSVLRWAGRQAKGEWHISKGGHQIDFLPVGTIHIPSGKLEDPLFDASFLRRSLSGVGALKEKQPISINAMLWPDAEGPLSYEPEADAFPILVPDSRGKAKNKYARTISRHDTEEEGAEEEAEPLPLVDQGKAHRKILGKGAKKGGQPATSCNTASRATKTSPAYSKYFEKPVQSQQSQKAKANASKIGSARGGAVPAAIKTTTANFSHAVKSAPIQPPISPTASMTYASASIAPAPSPRSGWVSSGGKDPRTDVPVSPKATQKARRASMPSGGSQATATKASSSNNNRLARDKNGNIILGSGRRSSGRSKSSGVDPATTSKPNLGQPSGSPSLSLAQLPGIANDQRHRSLSAAHVGSPIPLPAGLPRLPSNAGNDNLMAQQQQGSDIDAWDLDPSGVMGVEHSIGAYGGMACVFETPPFLSSQASFARGEGFGGGGDGFQGGESFDSIFKTTGT
ncbi:hypothetical protein IE53DRAFT_177947 [Violaceomyces palustris]|uniref:Uncharacterized protein n=1 Tax=Violaceomyces palustris TaxID=1673888 RepID=A0ACD0NSR1_9BASI|nr:hypothetical protein IE53DRAFT_177947 [Violaceomyces palustris]